jgi:hypothetical protein
MGALKHLAAVIIFLVAATPILAHRQPEALTTISFNENTGTWEIVHRFHAHDAERAIGEMRKEIEFDLENLEDRARFALYVEERFGLRESKSQSPIDLVLVGAALEDHDILVFQEFKGSLPDRIAVRQDVLRDWFPNQRNTVNIEIKGTVRTLVFTGEDKWKAIP